MTCISTGVSTGISTRLTLDALLSFHVMEGPSPAPTSEAGLQKDLGRICSSVLDLIFKPKCLVSRVEAIQSHVMQMTHNA